MFNKNIFKRSIEDGIIIAEIGVNHEGDLDKAIMMIDQVADNGGDAAKFQSYKADLLARRDSPAYWDTKQEPTLSQYKLFSKYDKFGEKENKILAKHCKEKGIVYMSTPFDSESALYVNNLSDIHKVASVDITNHCLLKQLASFNKQIILSTGASTLEEIKSAVSLIENKSKYKPALLHCVVNYPTKDREANLLRIKTLSKKFKNNLIGYSDHTFPDTNMTVCTQAYILGARIIEKHFTFDKKLQGNDHYHSMDALDLNNLRNKLDRVKNLNGGGEIDPNHNELPAIKHARRSLTSKVFLKSGTILTEDVLIPKRPGDGIPPSDLEKIKGKKLNKDIPEDRKINWSDIS